MEAGLLDEHQLKAALAEQKKWGGKLGRTLVEMGFIDEDSMVHALSRQLNLPLSQLDKLELPVDITQLLRVDLAERYGVFPIGADRKTRTLQIATADPTNIEALQELAFTTGLKVNALVASASAIERAIRRYYYGESASPTKTGDVHQYGTAENEFDPAMLVDNGNAPRATPSTPANRNGLTPSPPASPAPDPELTKKVEQLTAQVQNLERVVANQVRAMRGFLELLVEKGTFDREEYLARIRGTNHRS